AIDVHTPGVGSLLKLIAEGGLTNLRLVQHDAVEVLEHMIAPEALAGGHIFFPDPWPKKRHHKRRLVQPGFVALLAWRLSACRHRLAGVRRADSRRVLRRARACQYRSGICAAPGLPAADQIREP